MLALVANRHQGMPEWTLLRLVCTFIVDKFEYALPYFELSKLETQKVDALLRNAYKQALGHLFSALVAHNTIAEITEAVRTAHIQRLAKSPEGRTLLTRLGITKPLQYPDVRSLPTTVQAAIHATPLPRNMNPDLHPERRQA
ncbi:hypothetical protein HPB48_012847 [Haemaphysalis longicornis]|uniref:Uncharacterized protein n=1 Tax=Haemaphysalis longicornis TaxID=44386 RepID=A0A9J6FQS1_HAELO|nr:hypothetical protein HPB48_012847 [Haemaphysalis longicornis]